VIALGQLGWALRRTEKDRGSTGMVAGSGKMKKPVVVAGETR
jgi:hypothetical protein